MSSASWVHSIQWERWRPVWASSDLATALESGSSSSQHRLGSTRLAHVPTAYGTMSPPQSQFKCPTARGTYRYWAEHFFRSEQALASG